MEQGWSTNICIIGGGPAGSTIARGLSELGHQVLLLEKEAFPRPHVGICLSSPTDALLDYLGLSAKIKQEAFAARKSTLVKWGSDNAVVSIQSGSHVDRGRFDQILLQKSLDAGGQILQPARAQSITHIQSGKWIIKANYRGEIIRITAHFLVDASGRSNILASRRIRYAPALFSLHATWKLNDLPKHDGFMEAGREAWLWAARLNGKQALISLYTDPTKLSLKGGSDLQKVYLSFLEKFSLLTELKPQKLISLVRGCDASSRYATNPVGLDFIRVGDANFTIDPMASQGVHLALSIAIQAAIVVNTLICYPENGKAAQKFYLDRQQERVRQFKERTAAEYAKAVQTFPYSFWRERAEGSIVENFRPARNSIPIPKVGKIRVCPQAKLKPTPVLKDHRIELAPALHHPAVQRPVAYLGGKKLATLFPYLREEQSFDQIIDKWQALISRELGTQILQWLWERQVLILNNSKTECKESPMI